MLFFGCNLSSSSFPQVIGSHNDINTVRAAFQALDAVETPEEIAISDGVRLVADKGWVEQPLTQLDRRAAVAQGAGGT